MSTFIKQSPEVWNEVSRNSRPKDVSSADTASQDIGEE